MNGGCVFERREVKYLITDAQRLELIGIIESQMHPDEYGESTVTSLYFDTDDHRLIRRSAEHPLYKEKLRLRSYGVPTDDSTVFLEIKKKYDGRVYKRRISLRYAEFIGLTQGVYTLPETQIAREIRYFMQLYPSLSPKILVCYERSAYIANDDATTRITFDRNVRYRLTEVLPHIGTDGEKLVDDGKCIMELKFFGAVPKYISDAITQLGIKPFSFSKCGTAYNKELLRRKCHA